MYTKCLLDQKTLNTKLFVINPNIFAILQLNGLILESSRTILSNHLLNLR